MLQIYHLLLLDLKSLFYEGLPISAISKVHKIIIFKQTYYFTYKNNAYEKNHLNFYHGLPFRRHSFFAF